MRYWWHREVITRPEKFFPLRVSQILVCNEVIWVDFLFFLSWQKQRGPWSYANGYKFPRKDERMSCLVQQVSQQCRPYGQNIIYWVTNKLLIRFITYSEEHSMTDSNGNDIRNKWYKCISLYRTLYQLCIYRYYLLQALNIVASIVVENVNQMKTLSVKTPTLHSYFFLQVNRLIHKRGTFCVTIEYMFHWL